MEVYDEVARQYATFADDTRGYSPSLEEWALAVAGDPEVQAWIAGLPRIKRQPNLVLAAARWHGVPAPGPYTALREALLDDDGTIRATILARATQTNEAGRLATLTPAFATVAGDAPLALLEVGASAGLCLYPDRWGYAWSAPDGEHTVGPAPHLPCGVTGLAPLPDVLPEVAWRGGIDLNPLDPADDDAAAWLETLVWPEHDDRQAILRHGLDLARAEPPHLVAGDLLDELPALVEAAGAHGDVVVFHTAVIAYLTPQDRERFTEMMAGLVADGACRWISNETPNVLPEISAGAPPQPDGTHFAVGVDGRPVAWAHQHGRALAWFAD